MILSLKHSLQDYPWGSHHLIQELTDRPELIGTPVAELWLGAHPKAPSYVETSLGTIPLDQYLKDNPQALGTCCAQLPFLMKVLAAQQPLSIQAHPNQRQAETGFERENELGIPIDDPKRCYKDARHKPELALALTDFVALCGFRPYEQIVASLTLTGLDRILAPARDFIDDPRSNTWKACFEAILRLKPSDLVWAKEHALDAWCNQGQSWQIQACEWMKKLLKQYPEDAGILAPMFFNIIEMKPGEAIFLDAGTPHAYLKGAAIEVMANSDNVLRGGLTKKHIDLEEYLAILDFEAREVQILSPLADDCRIGYYPSPAAEFRLGVLKLVEFTTVRSHLKVPAIALCLAGEFELSQGRERIVLAKGKSAFIDAQNPALSISGCGEMYFTTVL